MKKLLLIVNPYAGRQQARTAVMSIIDCCDEAGYTIEVHPTRGKDAVEELVRTRAEEFDLVMCCGGDGTLNQTVTGLMAIENRPRLGYIPLGTANDFARTLGISRTPLDACRQALYGSEYSCDVGRFNDKFFTYIAAFGAFTDVSYLTPQAWKNTLGHPAYILEGVRRLPELRPQRVRLEWDEGVSEDDYIFGAVTNSTSLAGLLRLKDDKVNLSDGKFEVMLVKNPHDITQLNAIVTNLFTQNFDDNNVRFFHTSKAVITNPDGMTWTIDGEDGGRHDTVVIENCPKAITLQL